jgi:hypothetical protein
MPHAARCGRVTAGHLLARAEPGADGGGAWAAGGGKAAVACGCLALSWSWRLRAVFQVAIHCVWMDDSVPGQGMTKSWAWGGAGGRLVTASGKWKAVP